MQPEKDSEDQGWTYTPREKRKPGKKGKKENKRKSPHHSDSESFSDTAIEINNGTQPTITINGLFLATLTITTVVPKKNKNKAAISKNICIF